MGYVHINLYMVLFVTYIKKTAVFAGMLISVVVLSTATVYSQVAVVDEPRPPGLKDGITYDDSGTTAWLSLFAPHKNYVYVLGDFNNWEVQDQFLMKRDSVNVDSVYFWIRLDGLEPGSEYGFQYLVDGNLRVADPYAEKILDSEHDSFISEDTYPNLKSYPVGKTSFQVGVLQPGKEEYQWSKTAYQRPPGEELIIYELLVRDFTADHTFSSLIDTLDYLENLGVNAIELMPVSEFEGNISWGYNPSFHLAVDKYYGPAETLKQFVDECHTRNIAVILDIVLNHAFGQSPLVRLWNEGAFGAPTGENPYLNSTPKHDFNVGYDFNHESRATQYFVDRVTEYWLTEFNLDGFRFDLSKGFTQKNTLGDVGAWGEYDAGRIRLLKRMADHIRAVDPGAYIILEHFSENNEEKELADDGMLLWGKITDYYNEATMGYHDDNKSDFDAPNRNNYGRSVYYRTRGWDRPALIGFMESHDEQRLMYKNLQFAACENHPLGGDGCNRNPGSYNARNPETALNRMKMAGAFFFTVPGPKMIWQFGELGYEVDINQGGRTAPKPIRWDYWQKPARRNLYRAWAAILALREAHEAFRSSASDVNIDARDAIKRIVINHLDLNVSIVGNFGLTTGEASPGFGMPGSWFDYFTGEEWNISDTDTTIVLQPGEFHIFTSEKFVPPDRGILGSPVESDETRFHSSVNFFYNYPNPFNTSTTVTFQLFERRVTSLEIYNILGRKVLTMVKETELTPDIYTMQVNANRLSSGIYIIRLEAGDETFYQKMTLVK